MRVVFYFQMIGTQKHASSYMYRELIPFLAFPYREFHHAPMPNVKRRKNDSEYEILRFNANASFISIMPLPSIFISKACCVAIPYMHTLVLMAMHHECLPTMISMAKCSVVVTFET